MSATLDEPFPTGESFDHAVVAGGAVASAICDAFDKAAKPIMDEALRSSGLQSLVILHAVMTGAIRFVVCIADAIHMTDDQLASIIATIRSNRGRRQ